MISNLEPKSVASTMTKRSGIYSVRLMADANAMTTQVTVHVVIAE